MLLGEDISVMEIVRLWMERPKVQISHSQEKNTTEGWEMSEDCIEGLNEKAEEDTDDLCTEEQHLMAWENISWKESWNSMVYEKLYLVPYSPH